MREGGRVEEGESNGWKRRNGRREGRKVGGSERE